jgi:hypothetical protein
MYVGLDFSLAKYCYLRSDFCARAPVVYPTPAISTQLKSVLCPGRVLILLRRYNNTTTGCEVLSKLIEQNQIHKDVFAYQMSKRMCVIQRKWVERVCKNDSPCLSEVVRSP